MVIVHRAGFAMHPLDIHHSDLGVMPHHIQGTVPQKSLQGKHISARRKIIDKIVGEIYGTS